ncbi:YcxB family protein [Actinomadura sp. KC06]|uniref:YcxB family protein n=1 Tax=Actinomadura sp. KC06 TaxID=2530369 RepID=UPI00104578C1|nr:YcxB family protein [Actinomadura sp. KC06]TDD26369.1 YcxB family protein [Actinomadura sp. KC06]
MNIGDGGITVSYEPAPDEVARAFFHGLRRQLAVTYTVVVAFLIGATIFCFAVGQAWVGAALLVSTVAAPLGSAWWLRLRLRKMLAFLCVPTTMRLTAEGYECRTDKSTTTMRWSMFSSVVTTGEFWLFFLNKQPAAFLPKSAFDAGQQAQIAGFLAAREPAKTR